MKKILSLILALSLIISVAPMSFATGAGETVDEPGMYFNFSAAAYGSETDIVLESEDENVTTIKKIDDSNNFANKDTDEWLIDGYYALNTVCLTSNTPDTTTCKYAMANAMHWYTKSYGLINHVTKGGTPTGDASGTVAIILEMNEEGTFTPEIKIGKGPTSSNYEFYLAPKSAYKGTEYAYASVYVSNRAPLNDVYKAPDSNLIKLGEYDCYSENVGTETLEFDPVTISSKGQYYLYAVAHIEDRANPATGKDQYATNLFYINFTPCSAQDAANAAFTAEEDPDYSSATAPETASVKTLALYGDTSDTIGTESVTYGETATINEVPATVTREDGTYNFLYWAKGLENGVGNKHIISTSNESFSYKPHEGNNYLIAVYEKEGAEKEAAFYDRNGQLLNLEITDGKLPALPAMAGLGDATGWEQLGTNAEFEGGAAAPETGDMVFMAKYNEPTKNIAISINGVSNNYAYGDPVECKIDEAKKDSFSYWFKTINGEWGQIVSLDETYTFNAWEPCTVTAVYNGNVELANPRKIVLSTFSVGDNLTAVMAEFIGFDGAKEKGIMFGTKKIAMTTDYAQFTITNDTDAAVTVTGYAIVGDEKYVDGEVTVAAKK